MRHISRALVLVMLLSASSGSLIAFHPTMVRSVPAAGQALKESPTRLQVWFSDAPAAGVSQISLKRGDEAVALGETVVVSKDKSMYADPVAPLAAGSYLASWKTAGDDGHALKGEIKFTIAPK
jgi:methionine-rich copper-binding protein CopC